MDAKRIPKSALGIAGVLVLLYLGYGVNHPVRAGFQRMSAVNEAPPVAVSFDLSNAPVGTYPNTTK
jgi:hypothetical protein